LKLWIKKDFEILRDQKLIPSIKTFVNGPMNRSLPASAKELVALITAKEDGTDSKSSDIIITKKPPKSFIPKKTTEINIQEMHPEEIARQITLIEHDLFKGIQSREMMKQRWLKEKKNQTPNIHNMINRFNQVSLWVASEIVQVEDLKTRAIVLNRFIFIAQKCYELNNFNAVMEILSALNCSSVHRLKQTWDLLPTKSFEVYESLVKLMDSEGNFNNYREALKKSRSPIVPYLGKTLTDLFFISEGNTDTMPENKNLINWWKMNTIANVVKEVQSYQETPYNLEIVESIQQYLLTRNQTMTEEEMYLMSMQREEKVVKRRVKLTDTL